MHADGGLFVYAVSMDVCIFQPLCAMIPSL